MARITNEQGEFIKANYQGMMAKEIARVLGLNTPQVMVWARTHGVKKGRSRLFFDEELEFIEKHYLDMTYKEIAEHFGGRYSERQICGWINNNLATKRRVFNNHYFDNISTPNQAYWLGFIYADGWISSHQRSHVDNNHSAKSGIGGSSVCYEFGIELQRSDEYMLYEFNQEIGGAHKILQKHSVKRICGHKEMSETDSSVIRVYSKPFVLGLHKNGIDFNKTHSEVFPVIEDSLFPDFLRGYIDGDGCLHEMKPGVLGVHITSANKKVLMHIQRRLLDLYDIHTAVYTEFETKHRLYCFRQEDVRRLLETIYYDPNCTKLARKYEKYLTFYGLAA